jgi:uncharacterized iron-regulated membrane protein
VRTVLVCSGKIVVLRRRNVRRRTKRWRGRRRRRKRGRNCGLWRKIGRNVVVDERDGGHVSPPRIVGVRHGWNWSVVWLKKCVGRKRNALRHMERIISAASHRNRRIHVGEGEKKEEKRNV